MTSLRQFSDEEWAAMTPEQREHQLQIRKLLDAMRDPLPRSALEVLLETDLAHVTGRELRRMAEEMQDELRGVYGAWESCASLAARQELLHSQAAEESARILEPYVARPSAS